MHIHTQMHAYVHAPRTRARAHQAENDKYREKLSRLMQQKIDGLQETEDLKAEIQVARSHMKTHPKCKCAEMRVRGRVWVIQCIHKMAACTETCYHAHEQGAHTSTPTQAGQSPKCPSHILSPNVTGRPCAAVRPAIKLRNFSSAQCV